MAGDVTEVPRLELADVQPPGGQPDLHGGNSTLWRVDQDGQELLVKQFQEEYLRAVDPDALERLVDFARSSAGLDLARVAVWPTHLLTSDGSVAGVVMPVLPERFLVDHWGEQRVRDATLLTLREADAIDCGVPYVGPPQRLALLGRLLLELLELHAAGVVVNDLQVTNLALSSSLQEVRFLDCDSMFGPWGRPHPPVHPADAQIHDFRGGAEGDLQLFALLAVNVLQSELGTVPVRRTVLERFLRTAHIDLLEGLLRGDRVPRTVLTAMAASWVGAVSDDDAFVTTGSGRVTLWTDEHARQHALDLERDLEPVAPERPSSSASTSSSPDQRVDRLALVFWVCFVLVLLVALGAAVLTSSVG